MKTISSTVPAHIALNMMQDDEDKIESLLSNVKYNYDDLNDILASQIDDDFEHDILEMADYIFPVGSKEWKDEISRRFLQWIENAKEISRERENQKILREHL